MNESGYTKTLNFAAENVILCCQRKKSKMSPASNAALMLCSSEKNPLKCPACFRNNEFFRGLFEAVPLPTLSETDFVWIEVRLCGRRAKTSYVDATACSGFNRSTSRGPRLPDVFDKKTPTTECEQIAQIRISECYKAAFMK